MLDFLNFSLLHRVYYNSHFLTICVVYLPFWIVNSTMVPDLEEVGILLDQENSLEV